MSKIDALTESRRADSRRKRERTIQAIESMVSQGTRVTISGIASAAGVSTWFIYNSDIRVLAEQAVADSQHFRPEASVNASATELALALQRIADLKKENEGLKQRARLAIGAGLDQTEVSEFVDRISDLEREIAEARHERSELRDKNARLTRQRDDAVEELEAVRALNREMLNASNRKA